MSEEPIYNPELVMKIIEKINELHVDLLDAHQWKHLLRQRKDELRQKYKTWRH